MADPKTDVEQLNSALARIGERAAADPAYLESLRANQVEELRAAGVSVFALSGAFAEEGAEEEEEVVAFGFAAMKPGGRPGSTGMIASSICVGTCSSITLQVCCSKSFTGAGSGGAAGGAALGGA